MKNLGVTILSLGCAAAFSIPVLWSTPATEPGSVQEEKKEEAEDRPLAAGDAMPKFTLNDDEGNLVTVGGESEVWTLLAFYPKALTGG